jgi:hypothetical protein
MYSEMLKRMAQKDVAAKKAEEIQKITQIADSEGVEVPLIKYSFKSLRLIFFIFHDFSLQFVTLHFLRAVPSWPQEEINEEELERIRRRQAGTAVTNEVFEKWRIAFEAEMMGEESVSSDKERSAQAASLLKPTGKALFSSNRAGMEDALLAAAEAEEACAAAAAAVASVTGGADAEGVVAAAGELFEEDDVDLDALEDLDFDDDDDDEDDEDYVDPYSP